MAYEVPIGTPVYRGWPMTHGFYNSEMGYYAGPSSTPMPAPHVGAAGVFTSNTPVGVAGYFGTPYRPPTAPS